MKTYKKTLTAIGIIILDFLICYFGLRLLIYIGYAQEVFVDKWTIVALMFVVPFALNVVALIVLAIIQIIRNIIIHIKYGLKNTGRNDDRDYDLDNDL